MAHVKAKNPAEPEFHQAVQEVAESLEIVLQRHPEYRSAKILERMVEPERVIMFRVPWMDDQGEIHINRGFRIQMNSAIGPYKGGLRFHPSVTLGILKFLAFEQVFKNSLTSLPMGGGKGGSDFDPKGKSDNEVMRFCQSFMTELFRHIGPDIDVPAGDIGVGAREIGFLFGQYKRSDERVLRRPHRQRIELGRFADPSRSDRVRRRLLRGGDAEDERDVLRRQDRRRLRVRQRRLGCRDEGHPARRESGHALRSRWLRPRQGRDLNGEKIDYMLEMRASARDRVQDFADKFKVEFYPGARPWGVKVDVALPCATQNELDANDARELVKNGCACVCEGANMPTTLDGVKVFLDAHVLYSPGKASNAGGVATSGLEMSQNSMRLPWPKEEVDQRLHQIMKNIHQTCIETAEKYGTPGNYVNGANIGGFLKVADAMLDQGLV